MSSLPEQIVFLTAAVNPSPETPFVSLTKSERIPLYKHAFKYWSEICVNNEWHLFIVETTGAPADSLVDQYFFRKDFQFINHFPPSTLNRLGKGALESSALDFGFKKINEIYGEESVVHKVSGKLMVNNHNSVLKPLRSNFIRIRRSLDRHVCDSRIFSLTPKTWSNYFEKIYTETNDFNNKRYFEHVISQRMIIAEYENSLVVEKFEKFPLISGISGTDGRPYGGLTKNGWSNFKERYERHLLPKYRSRLM